VFDSALLAGRPETRELAMKIGGENSSDKMSQTNFERVAEDAGLAEPHMRRRVPELAEAVLSNMEQTRIEHPVAKALAGQVRECCDSIRTHCCPV
jgi:hypothetical protein